MTRFADRFDAQTQEDAGDVVEVRSHRGERKASIHRQHIVPETLFARLLNLGQAYGLHTLGLLDPYGETELNRLQAESFDQEVAFLAGIVNDPLLGPHLDALREVAAFCWQAPGPAWMRVEGP